jgi:hypothetical protein
MPIYRRMTILAFAGLALAFVLAGCQFPGATTGVYFTSPTNGTYIYSATHPASVVVKGQLLGGIPDTFSMTLNGTVVTSTVPASTAFSQTVSLADGANSIVVTVTTAGVTKSATLDLYYPFLAFNDGQAANVVMGQTNANTGAAATSQTGLSAPTGAAALINGMLYIPDTGNNRIVGYTSVPTLAAGAPFNILLGKPAGDWTNGTADTVSRTNVVGPAGVASVPASSGGASALAAVDTQQNRVLIWAIAPTSSTTLPVAVVGQPGYYSTGHSCLASGLYHPMAAFEAGGKLIIADTGNNRVLIWNTVPSSGPALAPNLVLGQANFTSCDPNRNAGSPAANTLAQPSGVWTDGTHLVVADKDNNRVLIWNTFPTSNGQAADLVIGQADMTTGTAQPAAGVAGPPPVGTGLSGPFAVASNGNQLFIADTGYNRVLVFDTLPTADGATADRVLGQTDLTGTTANSGGLTASSLSGPEGVSVYPATSLQDGFVVVADTGNNRELLYQRP